MKRVRATILLTALEACYEKTWRPGEIEMVK